eukprot:scaffold340_cov256-Pinguiococcus_pyrenoidosus.AAC.50
MPQATRAPEKGEIPPLVDAERSRRGWSASWSLLRAVQRQSGAVGGTRDPHLVFELREDPTLIISDRTGRSRRYNRKQQIRRWLAIPAAICSVQPFISDTPPFAAALRAHCAGNIDWAKMAAHVLNSLVEKTSHWDKDERYMATYDLCSELGKDSELDVRAPAPSLEEIDRRSRETLSICPLCSPCFF